MKLSLPGIVQKASTTIDGSWRLYIDVPLHCTDAVTELMNHINKALYVSFVTEEELKNNNNSTTLEDGLTEWLEEDLSP